MNTQTKKWRLTQKHNLGDTAYLSELHAFHWGQIDVLSEAGRDWGEGRVARGHLMELRD